MQSFAQKAFPSKFPIWVPSRDLSKNVQHELFLSGHLFMQFLFIPPPTKARAPFYFRGSHRSDSYRTFFVRKSGTVRWHMEKIPAFYLAVFAFLSIPLHSRFLFLMPFYSASFLCFPSGIQKLAKMNTFKCNLLHKKPSIPNFQFGFQVVICPRMFNMNCF